MSLRRSPRLSSNSTSTAAPKRQKQETEGSHDQCAPLNVSVDIWLHILSFTDMSPKSIAGLLLSCKAIYDNKRLWQSLKTAWLPLPTHSSFREVQLRFCALRSTQVGVTTFASTFGYRCVAYHHSKLFAARSSGGIIDVATSDRAMTTAITVASGSKKSSKLTVNALLAAHDEGQLFVGCGRPFNRVLLYSWRDGCQLQSYGQHGDSVFAIAATQHTLWSGGGQTDKTTRLFDLESATPLASYQHKGSCRSILVQSPHTFFTGSLDKRCCLYDRREPESPVWSHTFKGTVLGIGQCSRGVVIVGTGRPDCSLHQVDVRGTKDSSVVLLRKKNPVSCVVSDAFTSYASCYDGTLNVTSLATRDTVVHQLEDRPRLHSLAVSSEFAVALPGVQGINVYNHK